MKRKIDHIDLNKHLTQQELLDYNSGVLGSEEMYRMELHLNECELCSDALEGIDQIKAPNDSINSINEVIRPQKQSVQLPRNYLAIAASIVLVAAIGFTFWMLNPLGDDKSLAVNTLEETQKEEKQEKTQPQSINEQASDTASFDEAYAAVPDDEEVEIQPTKKAVERETSLPTAETAKPTIGNLASEQDANNNQIIAQPQEHLADANLDVESTEEADENEMAMEKADQGMAANEQAPTQTIRAKRAAATQSITQPMEDRSKPEPAEGTSSYKTYIENNLVYPEAATENKVKGNVVLHITIAPNGTIKNITVVKGLGYGCDEEAKRLVLTGPQWLPAVKEGTPVEAHIELKVRFRP